MHFRADKTLIFLLHIQFEVTEVPSIAAGEGNTARARQPSTPTANLDLDDMERIHINVGRSCSLKDSSPGPFGCEAPAMNDMQFYISGIPTIVVVLKILMKMLR